MVEPPRLLMTSHGQVQWIVRTLRDRGRRIPRHTWAAGEDTPPIGRLEIGWTVSEKHRRQMHVARFTIKAVDALPMIRDVHLVALNGTDLILTGFEELESREYAQSWYCRLAVEGWAGRGRPEEPVGPSP